MFRLVEASERRLIANSTNMDAEMEETLSCLQVGEAYVYSTAFNKPQLVMTEDIREKKQIKLSIDNDLIRKLMHYWDNKQNYYVHTKSVICVDYMVMVVIIESRQMQNIFLARPMRFVLMHYIRIQIRKEQLEVCF